MNQNDLNDLDDEETTTIIEEAAEAEDGWAISYADLMTLISTFFILLVAFANFEKPTFNKKAKEVAKYFKGANVQPQEDEMTELLTNIEAISHDTNVKEVKLTPNGIEIVFSSSALFESGSAELNPDFEESLRLIIDIIKDKSEGKKNTLLVEGHTDDIPITTKQFPSNWELSGARATRVVRLFETAGFDRSSLTAVGYGDTRPAKPHRNSYGNLISENQAENRRIVLKVLKPIEKIDMGFDGWFDPNLKKENI